MNRCYDRTHEHSPLVSLHRAECIGAGLGLLMIINQQDAQRIVRTLCALAHVPELRVEYVQYRRARARGRYHCSRERSPLPVMIANTSREGHNLRTIIHELAHHIVWERLGKRLAMGEYRPHGPPFPAVFTDLCGEAARVWRDEAL